jgi:hypothetical protein
VADHGRQAEEARDPHRHVAPQVGPLDAALDGQVAGARGDPQDVALGLELLQRGRPRDARMVGAAQAFSAA